MKATLIAFLFTIASATALSSASVSPKNQSEYKNRIKSLEFKLITGGNITGDPSFFDDLDSLRETSKEQGSQFEKDLIKIVSFIRSIAQGDQISQENLKDVESLSSSIPMITAYAKYSLGLYFRNTSRLDLSEKYYQEALETYANDKSKREQFTIKVSRADLLLVLGRNQEAIKELKEGLEIIKDEDQGYLKAHIYDQLAVNYFSSGDYSQAIDSSFIALNYFKKLSDFSRQINSFNTIAAIKLTLGNVDEAIKYYKEAENVFPKIKPEEHHIPILLNLSSSYFKKKELDKSKQYILKAIDLITYLNSKNYYPFAKTFQARIELESGTPEIAIRTLGSLSHLDENQWLPSAQSAYYLISSKAYDRLKQTSKANKHLTLALGLLDRINLSQKLKTYEWAYIFNEKNKNFYKALEYHKQFLEISKKEAEEKSDKMLYTREIKYKSLQNKLLENENNLQKNNIEKNKQIRNILISGLIMISGLLGMAAYFLFKNIKLRRKLNVFYSEEKKLNRHFVQQLEKVYYPHQIKQMSQGADLEETMPVGHSFATVLVFDIVGSSALNISNKAEFLESTLSACLSLVDENYDSNLMISDGYRIKMMGDGFLVSIGFPFKNPSSLTNEHFAVELGLKMIEVFQKEVRKIHEYLPIHCCIGIANGNMESFFPKIGTKEYYLYGKGIVLATRYENMRKGLWEDIDFDSIILRNSVYAELPSDLQSKFTRISLKNIKKVVRDDPHAKELYYHKIGQASSDTKDAQPA